MPSELKKKKHVGIEQPTENKGTYHLLNPHILDIQHIPNVQLRTPTSRAAFPSTIDEPRTDITVFIKQAHGELVQLLAFVIHNLEKVASALEPHAGTDLQAVCGGKFAEDRV